MGSYATLLGCFACLALGSTATAQQGHDPSSDAALETQVEETLAGMSLEEKVAQLLLVGFGGHQVEEEARKWIGKRGAGGAVLFGRNIKDSAQVAAFAKELHGLAKVPIFLGVDQEGGNVIRVKEGVVQPPGNMTLGATRSSLLAYALGRSLGADLASLGFNMNLAPVLDVNSNPKNPVIGIRSYGEEAELVSEQGRWFVEGQQAAGVAAVAKHFPGHGDTQSDSHYAMPSISADAARLEAVELAPFRAAAAQGLDAVMTAHIAVPRVTGDAGLPATVSGKLLSEVLREQIGFQGIIVTDGLEMQGIVKRFGSGKAAVMALQAGADMPMVLWTPEVKEEVYRAILAAVEEGGLSEARINRSVRRILRVKARRGILGGGSSRRPKAPHEHQAVARRIAERGASLVKNQGRLLPLDRSRFERLVVAVPEGPLADHFGREKNVAVVRLPYRTKGAAAGQVVSSLRRAIQQGDLLVVAVANQTQTKLVLSALGSQPKLPIVALSLGSPYLLQKFGRADALLATYSYIDTTQRALLSLLEGELPITGRLPITLSKEWPVGHATRP